MRQPPFLFEPGTPRFVERALMRKQALFPSGQKHRLEFEAFCGMHGHDRNGVGLGPAVGVHDQRDVFEKSA